MGARRGHRRVRGPRCAWLHFRRKSSRFSFVQVLHLRTCLLSPPWPSYSGRKEAKFLCRVCVDRSLRSAGSGDGWAHFVSFHFLSACNASDRPALISSCGEHTHIIALAKEAGFLEHVEFNRPAPLVTSAISFRPPDFPLFFLLCMPRSNP